MPDSLTTRGMCCGHFLNWHNSPTLGGACSSGGCRCGKYISPDSDYVRCTAIRPGTDTIRRLECELVAGHSVDHQQGLTRWMDDIAVYPDKDPTLSAEMLREQLAEHDVTAGQKVTVEDVLDKLRRHGEVKPNPPLRVMDLELKPGEQQVGGDHYRQRSIQPWDIWQEYGMNAFEGAVLKYLLRWRDKGGVEDLKKARHTLDKLIEIEEAKGDPEAG